MIVKQITRLSDDDAQEKLAKYTLATKHIVHANAELHPETLSPVDLAKKLKDFRAREAKIEEENFTSRVANKRRKYEDFKRKLAAKKQGAAAKVEINGTNGKTAGEGSKQAATSEESADDEDGLDLLQFHSSSWRSKN